MDGGDICGILTDQEFFVRDVEIQVDIIRKWNKVNYIVCVEKIAKVNVAGLRVEWKIEHVEVTRSFQ